MLIIIYNVIIILYTRCSCWCIAFRYNPLQCILGHIHKYLYYKFHDNYKNSNSWKYCKQILCSPLDNNKFLLYTNPFHYNYLHKEQYHRPYRPILCRRHTHWQYSHKLHGHYKTHLQNSLHRLYSHNVLHSIQFCNYKVLLKYTIHYNYTHLCTIYNYNFLQSTHYLYNCMCHYYIFPYCCNCQYIIFHHIAYLSNLHHIYEYH